ncbi:MAG: DNA circularization N-terminal domain-containing protein [Planctomycetaceae bacterium]|nr:DNA circularization N-terminal domain-containing protein [Planctomycetaceae bacterium]
MSWRDNMRPASFRGARFWLEAHDLNGGRRAVVHQYYGRDVPFTADLGGLAKSFMLTAFVATTPDSDDYMPERDALLAALDKSGPGDLVHPYYGSIRVQLFTYRQREERAAGGMAIFDIAFGEAGAAPGPTAVRSPAAGMQAAASSATASATRNFAERFTLKGRPDFLRDEAGGVLQTLSDLYIRVGRLSGVASRVETLAYDISTVAHRTDDPLEFAASIIALPQAISAAFEEPWKRYRNLDGTYRKIPSLRGGPLDAGVTTTLLRTMDFQLDVPRIQYATASRTQQIANQRAIGELARQASMIEAARVAPYVNWRTLEEAEQTRDRLADVLDVEMETTVDNEMFTTLASLRVMVIQSVPPEGAQLPYLVERIPNRTMPALRLAYDLYGNIEKEGEIIYLNHVRHPGFVPGGEPLKVLANV